MRSVFHILLVIMLKAAFCQASELVNLTVNRMTEPKGIVRTGQFSWQIISEENDVRQLAYHIKVASTPEGLHGGPALMWDSDRRESSDMVQVFYQGRRFPYEGTVYWRLEVWLSNNEHLKSPIQKIETGSKSTIWNGTLITKKDNEQRDYFYYLRWLHTLQVNQADNGQLFQPIPDDTLGIPVDNVAAVLYSLYKDEGDVKVLYDYYNMVYRWMKFRCEKDSTISSQLLSMMKEMAQQQNLHADVMEYGRLRSDSTEYKPYWLYTDEPAWCGGAITQATSSIAYNRVEVTIPSLSEQNKSDVSHKCPYGVINSKWKKEDGDIINWEIQLPVGVQAHVTYPKGYADNEGKRSLVLGSGGWMLRIMPVVEN